MAWVLLPLALTALVIAMHGVGARMLGEGRPLRDRVCAAALLVPTAMIAIVHAASLFHVIDRAGVAALTAAVSGIAWAYVGREARRTVGSDVRALRWVHEAWPWGAPGAVALGFATWSAALLAPWAWDALGYHLPVVYDALQVHRLREVPCSVVFVNAYPHAGEALTLWWRALLPNDRWIDAVQIPAGLAGVAALAALGARAGVPRARALGVATLWLALPAVALQLATDYVDVMYASALLLSVYFAVEPRGGADVVLAALGGALVLALKPTGPPAVAMLALTVLVRARHRRIPPGAWTFALVLLTIGATTYLRNAWVHHNPVWPVEVGVGPLRLPGLAPAREYIEIGVPPEVRRMGWLRRLVTSWLTNPREFIYDQRLGGFFPLGPCVLLPVAVGVLAWRKEAGVRAASWLLMLCALAQPGAFHPRFTLALPAAFLVVAMVGTTAWQPRARGAIDAVLVAVALFGVWHARGGFTDNRLALSRLPSMSVPARLAEVGVDNLGDLWWHTRASVPVGDAIGYDDSFELPGLLYRDDGAIRVLYLPTTMRRAEDFASWLQRGQVSVMVLSDEHQRAWMPLPDVRLTPLFRCRFDPCTVFAVRNEPRPPARSEGVLVIAPHPDDEVLIAGGVIARAVADGRPVDVVVVTNGDYTCARDGYAREDETVAALAQLGVAEHAVHFLGYPDGYLRALGTHALAPIARRDATGACITATGTYARRGEHGTDEHTARSGTAGAYTADGLVDDLAAILVRLYPHDVYLTHPMDAHPDHAATYAFFRRALERPESPHTVTVHRAFVHAGPCWPNGNGHSEPCPAVVLDPHASVPPLPWPFEAYAPTEHVAMPAAMFGDGEPTDAVKYRAIVAYRSQTGPDPLHNWLATFVRAEEVFYPEALAQDPTAPGRVARVRAVRATHGDPEATLTAPAECRWNEAGAQRDSTLSVTLEAGEDTLAFTLRDGAMVEVTRGLRDTPVPLIRAQLPEDHDRALSHAYTLRLDPRPDDGGALELTVRRDDAVLLVAVDPHPAPRWTVRATDARGGVTVNGWGCEGAR